MCFEIAPIGENGDHFMMISDTSARLRRKLTSTNLCLIFDWLCCDFATDSGNQPINLRVLHNWTRIFTSDCSFYHLNFIKLWLFLVVDHSYGVWLLKQARGVLGRLAPNAISVSSMMIWTRSMIAMPRPSTLAPLTWKPWVAIKRSV